MDLLRDYLVGDSGRIVRCSWDEELIEDLGNDIFRLQNKPIDFLVFNIQPQVTIEVVTDKKSGKTTLKAKEITILGAESLSDRVNIEVNGSLEATEKVTKLGSSSMKTMSLEGKIEFTVSGTLPSQISSLTPTGMLQSATGGVNRRLTEYTTQKFRRAIVADYEDGPLLPA
eukprot:CAMPEP_0194715294 /NCGR_PEP_ID=MMETSP0296-20130528/7008_1 /TAXON_ID=39354 /ORGANISM="Heterosigma akashiwo, Strain CCMP2393" /LENGTH=170 /DNA_ID=CAMNT_0039615041 /DNA_START=289 /DNA_END=805 /DNA_ORIENTATION=-